MAAQRAITEMRKRVQAQVERLPISYFDSTQTGKLISRVMNDAEGIRNLVGTGIVQLVGSCITAVIAPRRPVISELAVDRVDDRRAGGVRRQSGLRVQKLRPMFANGGDLQRDHGPPGRIARRHPHRQRPTRRKREELVFARGAHNLFRNIAKSMTGVSAITAFSSVIIGAVGVVMITVGGHSVMTGQMTLGDLFMYVFFTGLMAMPVIEIAAIGTQITEAFAGLDRIREILNMSTEDEEDAMRDALDGVRGDIEFEDVVFEYNEGAPVLKGVSFKGRRRNDHGPGRVERIGQEHVDQPGHDFNRPKSGAIRIDGRELTDVKLREYRAYLGVVLQDNFLFDGTIAENIRFSKPHATMDDVREVSRIAHCHEFIEGFEEGLGDRRRTRGQTFGRPAAAPPSPARSG